MKQEQECNFLFKLFLLGEAGVGKSNLLLRYTNNIVLDAYRETIGIDLRVKIIKTLSSNLKLHLWDTAGDQRFREIVELCFAGAHGALICFDLTNKDSFNKAKKIVAQFRKKASENAIIVLIGCKSDLVKERVIDYDVAQKGATELGLSYFELSAHAKININEPFEFMVRELLLRNLLRTIKPRMEMYFEDHAKHYSRNNTPGLFTAKPSNAEILLQNRYQESLSKLFQAINSNEVIEFYKNTLKLIKEAESLYAEANPFWSNLVRSPLVKMLRLSLADLCTSLPYINDSDPLTHIKKEQSTQRRICI